MRSAISALLLLALCAACGNYSNDDLVFLSALPDRQSLRVDVPAQSSQPLCANGEADAIVNARKSATQLNAAADAVLGLVDVIRAQSPTTRKNDLRAWGPFPDDKHPGVSYTVYMLRAPAQGGDPDRFTYAFVGQRAGGEPQTVIDGGFVGAQAKAGQGALTLHFDAARALGTSSPSDPAGNASFAYDRTSDPRTLEVTPGLFGAQGLFASYRYGFAGYANGSGRFDFAFPDASGNRFTVEAHYDATGAGRGLLTIHTSTGIDVSVEQCWDALACVTYLNDPAGIVKPGCGGQKPCVIGTPAACPADLP